MDTKVKTWSELNNYCTPDWMKKAKFGIYTHWGVYSVPAFGPNVSWYPYKMYQEGSEQYAYHCKTFGNPRKVGYKDLIPMFDGKFFDADAWAELFKKSGARFAGPVGEHHDGFSMWNSSINPWNAAKMGPKRDVVGELEKAIRKQNMHFMVAMHHAENWKFYPHWVKEYDTSDPAYAGLYGEAHNVDWGSEKRYLAEPVRWNRSLDGVIDKQWAAQDLPSVAFHELWLNKLKEVVDQYSPDYVWFDFGLGFINDLYQRKFLTYYHNVADKNNQKIVVSYKWNHLPVGTGLVDVEQGRFNEATYHDWITDTTIDAGEAWGYMKDAKYKTAKELIHYLIDNVSKNGYLLLNVGPKPDGRIPEEAERVLLDMGEWLQEYGEAIYDTEPWRAAEEGPTKMIGSGAFSEMNDVTYTERDIRYTMHDQDIYAIALGKVGDKVTLNKIFPMVYENEIDSIQMLGEDRNLTWTREGDQLIISTTGMKKNEIANVFRITRREWCH